MIFVGDDWAEDHHDVHLMDETGVRLASRRLSEGLAGIGGFHQLLARRAEEPDQVVIGIDTTAKCRKNYAGTSPLTVASGRKRAVLARHVRNRRLYDAIDRWAFCAPNTSPGARLFYDQRRHAGDLHHQALRALGNRLVGILHGCLRHRVRYNEHKAWAHRQNKSDTQAA